MFGIARFRYYAIADGIKEILSGRVRRVLDCGDQETQDRVDASVKSQNVEKRALILLDLRE